MGRLKIGGGGKKNHFFLTKKKKKKKLWPPDRPQFWPPAGQETHFFKGGLVFVMTDKIL